MTPVIKWGLSVVDWQRHAIEEYGDHPIGVYIARCGHRLMMVTELHEEPAGRLCETCAGSQLHDALTGTRIWAQP
ncbi:MAG: hypothetical protein ACRDSH_24620 [Pseudonocardiaceae bacterium]